MIKGKETVTLYGEMLKIFGVGVLITGNNGIGKSETAMELLSRGHVLVADDSVIVTKQDGKLSATCPEAIKHFMEIRGVGIIDVKAVFGEKSVQNDCPVDLVAEFENWQTGKAYERVGRTTEYADILGVAVPKLLIPVTAGRNLAVVLEVAAREHLLKQSGNGSAEKLEKRIESMRY